ncbi:hypothetical protein [Rhodopirellula bahusiensis]|uniref:DUF433 domain-containing protein n=1 Tax=Rhodopirellula bahusiensis TaxID=2014065 RepID=A0A2G1W822_9BACT|nr:hypothetical protein [Rhodopirellula bahusiensis]PHQ35187.1 hypothetical protein CEE69_12310 [Rhodopirellula bahusiensis]
MVKITFDIDSIDIDTPARDLPRYTIAVAAGYLNVPKTTLSSWFFGTTYGKGLDKSDFAPVLIPASEGPKLLSFDNLVEAYVLRMFRTIDRIALRPIGVAIENARQKHGIQKPLLHEDLFRGGRELFLERAGEIVGLSDPSQQLLPGWESYLTRVRYRDEALAAIFPLTRRPGQESPLVVSISPEFSFGSSVVDRTKVKTSVIADRYLTGETVRELSNDFACKTSEIEESIRAEWMFANAQPRRAA